MSAFPTGRGLGPLIAAIILAGSATSGCASTVPTPAATAAASALATASAAPGSLSPSSTEFTGPTAAPHESPLSWADVLGERRTFGSFTVLVDPAYVGALEVREGGSTVGRVYLDTYSSGDFPAFDVTTIVGLREIATDFVDSFRADRRTIPESEYAPIGPTEVAVGSGRGLRYGFVWKDHVGNIERVVQYVAGIPGGILFVQTNSPSDEHGRPAFTDDATLVRFLPVLDQIVADLRL